MPASNNRLKIGLVLDDSLDKDDGVQQYVLILGQWLKKAGHDVHFLVGSTKRSDIENIHSLSRNMNVRFNGNRMSMPIPSSNKKLHKLLETENFDVLHVQMPYSPYLAHRIILNCSDNTAIVGTFHIVGNSVVVTSATRMLRMWTSKSLKRFDEIISVSTAAQSYALKTFKRQSVVLPNIINFHKFHDAEPFIGDKNVTSILFLGRLVPRKGCLLLLQAANELYHKQNITAFKVIICGKGPLLPKLQKYVSNHGLKHIVEFKGYVTETEKPRHYASSDISVFPSHSGESFGIVLLEAMASGRAAVLGGNNIGYRAVLTQRSDLLFNPFSPAELAEKIKFFIENHKARSETGSWGENYARSFDVDVIGPNIVNLYQTALRNRLSK